MDAIVDYLPSPLQRPPIELEPVSGHGGGNAEAHSRTLLLKPSRSESMCALVFKVVFDPHRGPLSFARVYSGVLRSKATVNNSTRGEKERVTKLLIVHADHHTEVEEIDYGNIVAIAGLRTACTGDTLVGSRDARTHNYKLRGIDLPEPVFTCSIEAESAADADALDEALVCVTREDPSVHVTRDEETVSENQRLFLSPFFAFLCHSFECVSFFVDRFFLSRT